MGVHFTMNPTHRPSSALTVNRSSRELVLERAKALELPTPPIVNAETMPPRFGDFVLIHFFPHVESTLRASTVRLYRERWRTRIEPTFGNLTWPEITPMRVLAWVTSLARAHCRTFPGRQLAPRTVKQAHDTLSGMCQLAFLCGLLPSNPARQVRDVLPPAKAPQWKRVQPKRLHLSEVRKLLLCPDVPFYRRVEIAFAIYTCCRPGEVRAARWRWLQWRDGIPLVHVTETDDVGTTKTGEDRFVPLHPELVDLLNVWREKWRTRFDRAPTGDDFLFPNSRTAERRRPDHTHFRRFLERAGVPLITPHGLRHTGAQLLRDTGCPQSDVGAVLGHADTTTTGVYTEAVIKVLDSWIRRVLVLGADAGRRMLASRPGGPVCVQAMQQLTLSRGVLSGQCSASRLQPINKISGLGYRNPQPPCASAPLFSDLTAAGLALDARITAGALRGTAENAVAVILFAPPLERVAEEGATTPVFFVEPARARIGLGPSAHLWATRALEQWAAEGGAA